MIDNMLKLFIDTLGYNGGWVALGTIIAVIAYLFGSLSCAIIIVRLWKHDDIRKYGSGSAGGTNVLRNFGVVPAVLTLAGDFLKGVAAIIVARFLAEGYGKAAIEAGMQISVETCSLYGALLAGAFCVIGHVYPIYFKFKGGKGVITTASLLVLIDWRIFLVSLAAFLIATGISKMVSLGSICAGLVIPISVFIFNGNIYATIISACIAAFVIYLHKNNIARIIKGTESKVSFKKKTKPQENYNTKE